MYPPLQFRCPHVLLIVLGGLLSAFPARAVLVDFFNANQSYLLSAGANADTLTSDGYTFSYTMDKLFTGGTGQVIGRTSSVTWPAGLQAQAVTTGLNVGPAKFTIRRVDHAVFDLTQFTAKLLANTAGAGGSIEIMPQLNGEDGLSNPVALDVTGYAGMSFTYGSASTAALHGYDTYLLTLYVDFALTNVKLEGAAVAPEPSSLVLLLGGGVMAGSVRCRARNERSAST